MTSQITEALATWREAERLLDSLPPLSPDHESVALLVAELRDLYRHLSGLGDATHATVTASAGTIDRARMLIASVQQQYETNG